MTTTNIIHWNGDYCLCFLGPKWLRALANILDFIHRGKKVISLNFDRAYTHSRCQWDIAWIVNSIIQPLAKSGRGKNVAKSIYFLSTETKLIPSALNSHASITSAAPPSYHYHSSHRSDESIKMSIFLLLLSFPYWFIKTDRNDTELHRAKKSWSWSRSFLFRSMFNIQYVQQENNKNKLQMKNKCKQVSNRLDIR